MPDQEDYYEVLGVDREAGPEEIKRAYRDRCFILHPDRLRGAPDSAKRRAEEELKKVNSAYDVLGNPWKRREYDSVWRERASRTTQRPWGESRPPPPPSPPQPEAAGKTARPAQIERASWWWLALPIILSFIGGLIAYFIKRRQDSFRATVFLWVGIGQFTLIFLIFLLTEIASC